MLCYGEDMDKKATIFNSFYIEVFFKSWLFCCLVYSFMIFQFWWGNHDWQPLIYTMGWKSGLFEARYSQHLFTAFFLSGHVLPVFYVLLSLGFLSLTGVLSAEYLCVPHDKKSYFLFVFLFVCSPYTFVLFHYVFIAVSMAMWGGILILLMKLAEPPYKFWKVVMMTLGFAFILGGYPPSIAFAFVVFCGRKIILYQSNKQSFKQVLSDGLLMGVSAVCGLAASQLIIYVLKRSGNVVFQMYNVRTNSVTEMIEKIPQAFFGFFSSIIDISQYLGWFYAFITIIFCFGASFLILKNISNKIIGFMMLSILFLVARVSYIVSPSAEVASFRIDYWYFMAIVAVSISVFMQSRRQWLKNLVFAMSLITLIVFIRTDYEIQKVALYKFKVERLFHKRLEENIVLHPNFDIKGGYGSLNFGYPDFFSHVCKNNCQNYRNEVLDNLVLPSDLGYVLFWDEIKNPVSLKFGIWGDLFWRVYDPFLRNTWNAEKDDKIQDISMWLYVQAKQYPHQRSIYVDNKYLLLNLDEMFFYRNRGLLSTELQGFKK